MAIEYKLSYTAKEVDEKLSEIDVQSEKILELEKEIDDLSTVATSGSYNDLINKPTIPTSLPASGGNADTVDNKHASDFEVAGAANTALTNAKAYINQEISALINGDKYTGALDTIKEISEAITENADTIEVLNTAITSKVDKVSGKGLSTNDYTTTEKNKLAGIATGANAYSHPTTSGNKHIPSGGSSGQILRWGADGTAVWGSDNNTTYDAATQSANGLMSATDKKKLDGIPSDTQTQLNGKLEMDLLWENASPNSEFAAQTLTIGSGYDILIIFAGSYLANSPHSFLIYKNSTQKNFSTKIIQDNAMYSQVPDIRYRNIAVADTTLTFNEGSYQSVTSTTSFVSNAMCMPLRIYGIKGVN